MLNALFCSLILLSDGDSTPVLQQQLPNPAGLALDLEGPLLILGSSLDGGPPVPQGAPAGSARIFREGPQGFELEATLGASNAITGDLFGKWVAIDGDLALVHAEVSLVQSGEPGITGSVYAFERQGGAWVETQILQREDATLSDAFGAGLALSGERFAAIYGSGTARKLVAYERQGGQWVAVQELDFGIKEPGGVAMDGDTMMVSTTKGGGRRVSVLEHSGAEWVEVQVLENVEGGPAGVFGSRLDLAGDLAIAGATDIDGDGGVVVFRRVDGLWVAEQVLLDSTPEFATFFGDAVSVGDGLIAIGEPGADPGGQGGAYGAGQVNLFAWNGLEWVEQGLLEAPENYGEASDFGDLVAVSGRHLVVGDTQLPLAYEEPTDAFVYLRTFAAGLQSVAAPGNGDFLKADLPVLGESWTATADLTGSPGATALFVLSRRSAAVPLAVGPGVPEATILVDLSPGQLLPVAGPQPGPAASFTSLLPSDPSLGGLVLYGQAVRLDVSGLGLTGGLGLSNSIVLCLGS